ncbi:hypothetical protein PCANC_01685 [Puccinia coronata f. sp. avenae]|uniref:Uncharacterized protein n=1 Tax=Puccinia coronata f. sp. avenae TaxID=200324 RepID=A0A2N5W3C3_9BASI|nr:hypothetical protein PCANC_01685 [Puccinia coronata f. sp. avenae]
MFSKVFVAYVVIALGVVPASLLASPAPADAEPPTTVAHPPNATTPTAGPSAANTAAPANSAAPAPADAVAPAHAAAPANAAAPASAAAPTNAASQNTSATAAHPPANAAAAPAPAAQPPANATAAAAPAAAAAHPPANATAATKSLNSTEAPAALKAIKTNATAAAAAPPPAPESPPTTTCFSKSKSHGVEDHHCRKALEKVVFASNQTLDKFSALVFANYKTCNLHIRKPNNSTLKKDQLSSMIQNLTTICHSTGGMLSQSSKNITVRIERGTKENNYEVDTSICKKEQCPLTQSDCLSAFYQLPVDGKEIFVNTKGSKSFARVTSGNCTVTASTTDLSAFAIPRQFVLPTMKKLVRECGEHPGKIFFSGGAKGYNGDIWLSVRAANKETCQ